MGGLRTLAFLERGVASLVKQPPSPQRGNTSIFFTSISPNPQRGLNLQYLNGGFATRIIPGVTTIINRLRRFLYYLYQVRVARVRVARAHRNFHKSNIPFIQQIKKSAKLNLFNLFFIYTSVCIQNTVNNICEG